MLLDYSESLKHLQRTNAERQWPLQGRDWHRRFVGARDETMWQRMGLAQLQFLQDNGLNHKHFLLDVGCGSLRLGIHAIPFLMPYRYIGLDISERLVRCGIEQELLNVRGWQFHRPRFIIDDQFSLEDLGHHAQIDYAIAQSVFTHVGPKKIKQCLHSIMPVIEKAFFASFNLGKQTIARGDPIYPEMVCYPVEFFQKAAELVGCKVEYIGDWGIRQNRRNNQMMLKFTRLP